MRSVDVVDKGMGVILLGVGLSVAFLPVVAFAFVTLGLGFAELEILATFAETLTVVVFVGGEVRGTLASVVALLGFAKLVLVVDTSNPGFAEGATFVAIFPPRCFACGFWAVAVVPDAVTVALVSKTLSSDERSQ